MTSSTGLFTSLSWLTETQSASRSPALRVVKRAVQQVLDLRKRPSETSAAGDAGKRPSANEQRRSWVAIGALLLLSLLLSLLWFQGWMARRVNNLDMITFYRGALDLMRSGVLPEKGQLYSFQAYAPPGTAFLIYPGMALFQDPRLFEIPSTFLLYVGSVVVVFLIGRRILSQNAGLAAAALFALSRLSLQNPIETPFFVVLATYFLLLWVQDRKPVGLALAIIAEAIALYVYPKNLPMVLVFPALWFLYRPPVSWRSLLMASGIILAIWFPYLKFESRRGFVDVRSYVLREPIQVVEGVRAASRPPCLAELVGEVGIIDGFFLPYSGDPVWRARLVYPEPGVSNGAEYWMCAVISSIDRNFDGDGFLLRGLQATNALLWTVFVTGAIALLTSAMKIWPLRLGPFRSWITRSGLRVVCIAALWGFSSYALLDPGLVGTCCTADGSLDRPSRLVVEQLQLIVPLVGVAALLGLYLGLSAGEEGARASPFVPMLWIPWLALVFLSEPNRGDRFIWLWPVQVLAMVTALTWFARSSPRPKITFAVLAAIVFILLFPAQLYRDKIADWGRNGYGGRDTGKLSAVDYLGSVAASRGVAALAIGYQMVEPHFEESSSPDPDYREGTWFDFLLDARYGIHNLNQTVNGISDIDEYRVLELRDGENQGLPPAESPWRDFQEIAHFGRFAVYRRVGESVPE